MGNLKLALDPICPPEPSATNELPAEAQEIG